MPAEDTFVEAYCQGTHDVKVVNGNGGGEYPAESEVTISANCDADSFREWIIVDGSPRLKDVQAIKTTFFMPNEYVRIRAHCEGYHNLEVVSGIGSGY
eukprot:CAMPEP_0172501138 /NCGR_PEP_ID=MMETSP1066-20121228/146545_1 /TAXON_ID=671091 /ORGANISM="Coscinodiscus wailesii, Strain CCMP2513" /LENGTH=97 /DNA_ID=CAMNT_0013275761 /DNA_START=10 /DNA_END=300 /DNA_ORIENTATION=-